MRPAQRDSGQGSPIRPASAGSMAGAFGGVAAVGTGRGSCGVGTDTGAGEGAGAGEVGLRPAAPPSVRLATPAVAFTGAGAMRPLAPHVSQ
jgi:hypothetical protein